MSSLVEAGVQVVLGRPGGGKSFYAVRRIVRALLRGRPVATNVPLVEDWPVKLAGLGVAGKLRSRRQREEYAQRLSRLLYYVSDVEELNLIRLPACGTCERCREGGRCRREARGLCVLDEAPDWVDRRTWNVKEHEDDSPINRRAKVVRFFRKHRKRGWGVVLISQSEKMVDNQLLELAEHTVMVRNMRRVPHVANPLRWLRFDLFVASTYWGTVLKGPNAVRTRSEWYTLNKSLANLYDTMGGLGVDGEEDDPAAIWPWGHKLHKGAVRVLAKPLQTANDDERDESEEEADERRPDDDGEEREEEATLA